MQNKVFSGILGLTVLLMLQSCDPTPTEPVTNVKGELALSIQLGDIGNLSKSSVIDLVSLNIELSSGATVLYDTVTVSGNAQIISNNSYTDLTPGAWKVGAETRDVNGVVIHADSTTFTVTAGANVDVSLSLTAKYSMLLANFVALADSVSRCELLVDATLVADSSFTANSEAGSTISLAYDYLSTGDQHDIKLDVYGVMWGTESLLYTGDSSITVVAGTDNSYTIDLVWVGPNEAPNGSAAVEITVGRAGMVTVEATFPETGETVTDIDGNVYSTVTIGNQTWMAENLKVTHYRDGTPITDGTAGATWYATSEAYCIYNNSASNEVDTYGAMYNWYAVTDAHNIAPEGWHVPTDDEWQALLDYLGGNAVAGGKLKEIGTVHWESPNTGATNESGFNGLPGGYRHYSTTNFAGMGNSANFWSATEYNSNNAYDRILRNDNSIVSQGLDAKRYGFSVRLLKD